jgi:hypothetical protein
VLIGKLTQPDQFDCATAGPRVDGVAYVVAGVRRVHKA